MSYSRYCGHYQNSAVTTETWDALLKSVLNQQLRHCGGVWFNVYSNQRILEFAIMMTNFMAFTKKKDKMGSKSNNSDKSCLK